MRSIEIIFLIIGTAGLLYFSWNVSIKQKRYHGIPRFFVFESIYILVLCNYPAWFKDPFSLIQMISWILLFSSALIAFIGFYLLYERGKPRNQMENTTHLIKTGMYKYIRHPIYTSLIPGVLGILLKDIGYIQILLTVCVLVTLIITAKLEENEMIKKFGSEYKDYMRKTKMFIPFIY